MTDWERDAEEPPVDPVDVTLRGNTVAGNFADAGIYLGGIAAGWRVRAIKNEIDNIQNRGLIVENPLPETAGIVASDGTRQHASSGGGAATSAACVLRTRTRRGGHEPVARATYRLVY